MLLVSVYDASSSSPIFSTDKQVTTTYSLSPLSEQDASYQLITFSTPVLQANTTLAGNVSLCCKASAASDPFSAPSVFILTSSDYAAWQSIVNLKSQTNAFPSETPYEATTFGYDSLKNYTYEGPTGSEFISLSFLTKETSVYYFLVIGKGETVFSLNLNATVWMISHPYKSIFQLATIAAMIATVILTWNEKNEAERHLQERITFGKLSMSQTSSAKLDSGENPDEVFMRLAIELSKESRPEDDRPHPTVGAVVVKNGEILDRAFRGEYAQGDHAEYTLLERKLGKMDLTGTTLYTTLEPCTFRDHEKTPCADRIIQRRIGRVVIGMLDPNPSIQGKGMYKLDKAGIRVQLAERLTNEIKELNKNFVAAQERPQTNRAERAQQETDSKEYDSKTKVRGRLLPVSPFDLSPDLESKLKVVRGYTAAFAICWMKERGSLEIVMWYHPMMLVGLGLTDIGGEEIDTADFLDLVRLNPALKRYEFGLAGKPKNALVVIIEGEETEAWVAPLRLVDSLMGIRANRIRRAIRALV